MVMADVDPTPSSAVVEYDPEHLKADVLAFANHWGLEPKHVLSGVLQHSKNNGISPFESLSAWQEQLVAQAAAAKAEEDAKPAAKKAKGKGSSLAAAAAAASSGEKFARATEEDQKEDFKARPSSKDMQEEAKDRKQKDAKDKKLKKTRGIVDDGKMEDVANEVEPGADDIEDKMAAVSRDMQKTIEEGNVLLEGFKK